MTLRTALFAGILAVLPTLSLAMCGGDHEQTANSCIEGQVWDQVTQACVDRASS